MPGVNHVIINKESERKTKRKAELDALTQTTFNYKNEAHIAALKKYVDEFEYHSNVMYLIEATRESWKLFLGGLGLWLTSFVIYLPMISLYTLGLFALTSAVSSMLQNSGMTDFCEHVHEMQQIYNWSLKGGKSVYDGTGYSLERMSHPEIQRLIKELAPFCEVSFMIAWVPISDDVQKEAPGILAAIGNAVSSTTSYITIPISWVSAKPAEPAKDKVEDAATICRQLTVSVVNRKFDLNLQEKLAKALSYFVKDPRDPELKKQLEQRLGYFFTVPERVVTEVLPLIQAKMGR